MHCGIPNAYKIITVTIWNHIYYLLYMIPYCYSNYFVSTVDPTVHLTTLLIGSVFFEGLKMTQLESKRVAHVCMVVDIPINCCVRLLHLVPILH